MSLTGTPLLVVLTVVTLAVLGAALHPVFRHPLRRLALVAAAQLCAVALIGAMANDYGDFYPSWADLFGAVHAGSGTTASFGATAVEPGATNLPRGGSGDLSAAQATSIAAGLSPTDWSRKADWPTRGAVVHLKVPDGPGGPDDEVLAWLPPSWFSGGPGAATMPMLEMLTGYPGTPDTVINKMKAADALLAGIKAGTYQPTVLLITRPVLPFPRDTECTDVPSGPPTFSRMADTVPDTAATELHLHVTGLAAAGYSTGGYCALKLAMLRPDRFAGGASMSGYYAPDPGLNSGDLFGGSTATKNANDLMWLLEHHKPPAASVLVACSKEERFESGYAAAQQFLAKVHSPMAAQEIVLDSGGHNFDTWRAEFPKILPWLEGQLQHHPLSQPLG
jgi:hypothetical protein